MWLLIVCVGAVKKRERRSREKPILVKYRCIYTTLTEPLGLGKEQVSPVGLGLGLGSGDSPRWQWHHSLQSPGMAVPPLLAPGALRQQQISHLLLEMQLETALI